MFRSVGGRLFLSYLGVVLLGLIVASIAICWVPSSAAIAFALWA